MNLTGPLLVVDSSVLIEHLRGDREVTRFLEERLRDGVVLAPAIVAWELWKGARTRAQQRSVQQLLAAIEVGPFMPAMAATAAETHVDMQKAGNKPPAFDVLIASWALYHDAPLATLDRDYQAIPGLRLVHVPTEKTEDKGKGSKTTSKK